MSTRKHVHEENFPVEPERLFSILHTPSAIREWWGASRVVVLAEDGGTWAGTWGDAEDAPDYITAARIAVFDPPRRMVLDKYRYKAATGPLPFEASFVTEFLVLPNKNGSVLRVTQDGFPAGPEGDAFLGACATGWKDTFDGIRRYLG